MKSGARFAPDPVPDLGSISCGMDAYVEPPMRWKPPARRAGDSHRHLLRDWRQIP